MINLVNFFVTAYTNWSVEIEKILFAKADLLNLTSDVIIVTITNEKWICMLLEGAMLVQRSWYSIKTLNCSVYYSTYMYSPDQSL